MMDAQNLFDFEPFLAAPLMVQIHAITACFALGLGLSLFALRKGTKAHKIAGRIWVGLMVISALSALAISEIKLWFDYFSPIHLLVPLTLYSSYQIIKSARAKQFKRHRIAVVSLFVQALLGAGAFTFLPDRLISEMFFSFDPWLGFGGVAAAFAILALVLIRTQIQGKPLLPNFGAHHQQRG